MEKSSSGRNETNQKLFDSYCKRILKNEAIDCFREIQKHRQREIFFSELSEKEWKQLYISILNVQRFPFHTAERCVCTCTLIIEYGFAYRT